MIARFLDPWRMSVPRFPKWLLIPCAALLALPGCEERPVDPSDSVSVQSESSARRSGGGPGFEETRPVVENLTPTLPEALAALSEIMDREKQARFAGEIVSRLAASELLEWAASAAALPVSEVRDVLLKKALGKLAVVQPDTALQLALAVEPEDSARALAIHVADVWAATDFRSLFGFAGGLPESPLREEIWRIAVRAWCNRDLDGAFRHLAGLRYSDGGMLIGIAARRIGERDPEEAIASLDLIQDPRVWDAAAGRIFGAFAEEDPQAAVEWFLGQTDPKVMVPIAYSLGGVFAGRSAAEGVDLLNQLDDDVVAHHFLHGMIHRLNKGDMEDLLQNIPRIANPDYRASTALSTSRDLSRTHPDRNLGWIVTLTDENARAHAYQGAGMGYAQGDGQVAQAWLNSLPPGKDRRYAIFGFASEYASRDPVTSAAWAMTIQEPDVRERLVTIVVRNWNNRDPAAARAWAQATGYRHLLPAD